MLTIATFLFPLEAAKMALNAPFDILQAYGTKTDAGDVTMIAAPGAGYALAIRRRRLTRNVATDTTWIFKHGSTAKDQITLTSEIPGIVETFTNDEAIRLPENTAYVGNNSAAVSVTWMVRYIIEKL